LLNVEGITYTLNNNVNKSLVDQIIDPKAVFKRMEEKFIKNEAYRTGSAGYVERQVQKHKEIAENRIKTK